MKTAIHDALLVLQLGIAMCVSQQTSSMELPSHPGIVLVETTSDTLRLDNREITESPYYIEGQGSFTTSTGTVIGGLWGGISIPEILAQLGAFRRNDSVVFVASDGYEMTNNSVDILDESDGTWILAYFRDGAPLSEVSVGNRTIKVGPTKPNIHGHTSVQDVTVIRIERAEFRDFSMTVSGLRREVLDRQTIQSCVGCHAVRIPVDINNEFKPYSGVPLHRFLAYADDSLFIPHAQDMSLNSYRGDRARSGYLVRVYNTNGESVLLDSRSLHNNDAIILAYYRDSNELPENEAPLVLVGDVAGEGGDDLIYLPHVTRIELTTDTEH